MDAHANTLCLFLCLALSLKTNILASTVKQLWMRLNEAMPDPVKVRPCAFLGGLTGAATAPLRQLRVGNSNFVEA